MPQIQYSEKYYDDVFEYRCDTDVIIQEATMSRAVNVIQRLPRALMEMQSRNEFRGLFRRWDHFLTQVYERNQIMENNMIISGLRTSAPINALLSEARRYFLI
jgi:hypothetical protein